MSTERVEPIYRKKNLQTIAIYALTTCLILASIGWFTDVKEIGYGALVSAISIAFLFAMKGDTFFGSMAMDHYMTLGGAQPDELIGEINFARKK